MVFSIHKYFHFLNALSDLSPDGCVLGAVHKGLCISYCMGSFGQHSSLMPYLFLHSFMPLRDIAFPFSVENIGQLSGSDGMGAEQPGPL